MYDKLSIELKSRELRISEIFLSSIKVFWKILPSLSLISLFLIFPVNSILEILFPTFIQPEDYDYSVFATSNSAVIIATTFLIPGMGSIIFLTNQFLTEGKTNILLSVKKGFSRWGSFFGTTTLSGIIGVFLLFLFIIPGLIFFVRIYFITEAIILRDLGGESAISYSRSLVSGRWWKVFLTMLLVWINAVLLGIIIIFLLSAINTVFGIPFLTGFLYRYFDSLIFCFSLIVGVLFFVNLEYRK